MSGGSVRHSSSTDKFPNSIAARVFVTHTCCYTDGVRVLLTPDPMGNGRFRDPALGKNRPSSFTISACNKSFADKLNVD